MSREPEDVMQFAWESLWGKIDNYDGSTNLGTYIGSVTLNAAKQYYRNAHTAKRDANRTVPFDVRKHDISVSEGPDVYGIEEVHQWIQEEPDADVKQILTLRYIQGKSLEETGAMVRGGISKERVRQITARWIAKKRFDLGLVA